MRRNAAFMKETLTALDLPEMMESEQRAESLQLSVEKCSEETTERGTETLQPMKRCKSEGLRRFECAHTLFYLKASAAHGQREENGEKERGLLRVCESCVSTHC